MDNENVQTHEILMFGGPRVGKTTLLASMLQDSIRAIVDDSLALQMTPRGKGEAHLNEIASSLSVGYENDNEMTNFENVESTNFPVDYIFDVRRAGPKQPPVLALHFTDTPGEFTSNMDDDLKKKFSTSRAAILVVDALELMEGSNYKIPANLRRNEPRNARNLVLAWLNEAGPPSSLMLCVALMKCETWIRKRSGLDPESATKLLDAFKHQYREMLSAVSSLDTTNRVAVVICPVQSVGNLEFVKFEPLQQHVYPTPIFRKIVGEATNKQPKKGFAPVDADQPLRHLLSWVLIEQLEARRLQNESYQSVAIRKTLKACDWLFELKTAEAYNFLRSTILDIFGQDSDLARAVSSFVHGVKRDSPFAVLRGNDLISRRSAVWDFLNAKFVPK